MTGFVLVHGAWLGAWCWHRVTPLLERRGHRVITPELPGHGRDTTPASACSLDAYAATVITALDAATAPVVLVGHSLGGMVITRAAELRPGRIRALAYLAAFLPRDGESLITLCGDGLPSELDAISVVDEAAQTVTLRPEGFRAALCHDGRDDDVALAMRLARPEPLAPLGQAVHITSAGFGSVPRVYLECLDDRAVPLARQRRMQAALPCREVIGLASSHSPFFSMPETLVECLAVL